MADSHSQGTVSPTSIPLQTKHLMVLDNMGQVCREEYEGEELSPADMAVKAAMDECCCGEDWPDNTTGLDYERDQMYDSEQKKWVPQDTYYLYSPEQGLTDEGVAFLQWVLRSLDPREFPYLTHECAFTCSKMRPGEFGGAACFITRDQVHWNSTGNWLAQMEEEFTLGYGQKDYTVRCTFCGELLLNPVQNGRCRNCHTPLVAEDLPDFVGKRYFEAQVLIALGNGTWNLQIQAFPTCFHPEIVGNDKLILGWVKKRAESEYDLVHYAILGWEELTEDQRARYLPEVEEE